MPEGSMIYHPGTLNYFARKREYEHIQQANLHMVKVIRDIKPSFRREEWKSHIKNYERLKSQLISHRRNPI